ncbi:MAG: tRNA (adenosine(37)-N6)-dimethylallyltransferase, partial [Myxococcota bacterium]
SDARAAALQIHGRGRAVVLTGGTGLYIRVFLEGVVSGGAPDPEFREALEREHRAAVEAGDPARLHRRLAEADPTAAGRIHVNDLRRIVRALEMARDGASPSRLRAQHGFRDRPYRALHLVLDPGREALNPRIDERCREMIDAGLLHEVRDLCGRGYGPEHPPMQSIGYRHILPVVAGSDTLANALVAMQRDTRRFARRQRTWIRGIPEAEVFDPREPDAIFRRVEEFFRSGGQYGTDV